MTVRGLLLALALFASAPTEAASCHRYARWRYPWPQSCGAQVHASSRKFVALAHHRPSRPATFPEKLPKFGIDIALPFLARADCDGGEADEPTRARVLLRAALEHADAH